MIQLFIQLVRVRYINTSNLLCMMIYDNLETGELYVNCTVIKNHNIHLGI